MVLYSRDKNNPELISLIEIQESLICSVLKKNIKYFHLSRRHLHLTLYGIISYQTRLIVDLYRSGTEETITYVFNSLTLRTSIHFYTIIMKI